MRINFPCGVCQDLLVQSMAHGDKFGMKLEFVPAVWAWSDVAIEDCNLQCG